MTSRGMRRRQPRLRAVLATGNGNRIARQSRHQTKAMEEGTPTPETLGLRQLRLTDQRTTDNGQRTTDNGQRTTDNGQRTTDNGQRTTDNGQRTTDNGQRTTDNGQHSQILQTSGNAGPIQEDR